MFLRRRFGERGLIGDAMSRSAAIGDTRCRLKNVGQDQRKVSLKAGPELIESPDITVVLIK